MALLTSPASAAAVSALITRVRRMVSDTDSDTDNQRWSDTDIRDAIDGMLAQMYAEWTSRDPSGFITTADITYTADSEQIALADALSGMNIYKIEDVTGDLNTFIPYRSLLELNRYADEHGWSLQGANIALRPVPTGTRTLRVYALSNYIPTTATTSDTHPMPVTHEELICIGAAIRLQENDNEVPPTRLGRYVGLWEQFQKTAARYVGRSYVKSTRILKN
jgi:hypothetical protein